MEEPDLNKSQWKPKFKSEFSMGELDFNRYNDWLNKSDYSSAGINSCEIPTLEQVQKYFSEINVLYKNWRCLISSVEIKNKLDAAIKLARHKKRGWESSIAQGIEFNKFAIYGLIDLLDEIHTEILDIKQIIGLGIVVKKQLSMREKIKQGVKPFTKTYDLPEA